MSRLGQFFSTLIEYETTFVMLATLALAVITFFYLMETRKSRKAAESSLKLERETSKLENFPWLFIQRIEPKPSLDSKKNELIIVTKFYVTNIGKTPASSISILSTIWQGSQRKEKPIRPIHSLYPSQSAIFKEKFAFILSDENFAIFQEAVKKKVEVNISAEFAQPVNLNVKIEYEDIYGAHHEDEFRYVYHLEENAWLIGTDEN